MSCYICGRGNCTPMFHSLEEQEAYSRAEEAFDKFLEIREECREEFMSRDEEDELDD